MTDRVDAVCPQRILAEAMRIITKYTADIPSGSDEDEAVDYNIEELVSLSTALPNMWPPMPKLYGYIASTYALVVDDDITDIDRMRRIPVDHFEVRGRESRGAILIPEGHVQAVFDQACAGNRLGFAYRSTSRHDTRIIVRPVIVDDSNKRFYVIGPMYDGEKLLRAQIIADFLNRWVGMNTDAHPADVIVTLPK